MKPRGLVALLLILAVVNSAAFAAAPRWSGPNVLPPKLEARYQHLTQELRCPVCQNESVAVSNSRVSADIRAVVRRKLLAGESNQQIKQFMIARYGLFAVFKPPLERSTLLLWFGPLILLLIAALILGIAVYRRRRALHARGGRVHIH